jgi:type 1 glutamine amidotransferase
MIKKFAIDNNWQVFYTENSAVFNDEQLAQFAVVVWNNATGAALSEAQRLSFQHWLEVGGGYVGLHAAGDGSHKDWEWYTDQIIKAPYNQHTVLPEPSPEASLHTENSEHPATVHLPEKWRRSEEWYAWHKNPRDAGANILVTVDESSYIPGAAAMGDDHPVVWSHDIGEGRVFYSAFGHSADVYKDKLLVPMMEQGIIWAGRMEQQDGR